MLAIKLLKLVKPNTILKTAKRFSPMHTNQLFRHKSDLYEPDYLISMEPEEPVYDCLNLQIKGYDFAVLEAYQSQLHKYAEVMGIEVDECWATPAQALKIQRFKPGGTVVDTEYLLNVYERNVQVTDIPAWALGSLLRVARASLPEGCTLNVHEHMPEHEEVRYVPDNELKQLKQQLEDMGGSRAERKKKK
ncbi:unnamed protein product [Chilo suppressalis]|uniref:Small ribosomal subunit protein uS10 domain-containing protein n=1 Tax=Chilo suppressalis TaxID=168631 RepID=A0ABN8BIA6_CHISP|nr:unnamed protein product [Chilo suppressalis]